MIYAAVQENVGNVREGEDDLTKTVKVWGDEIDCLEAATLVPLDEDENMLLLHFKTSEDAAEFEGYMKRQQASPFARATNASP